MLDVAHILITHRSRWTSSREHSGRVRRDPATSQIEVMDGLFFANGVTLGPNEDYVLVGRHGARARLWLQGIKP